jgi:uncharacterized protein (TIGR02996 family)
MSPPATEAEYLQAIVRAPEDDSLRLAFASFIRPYEPPLAAFIDLQVGRVQRQRRAAAPETEQLPTAERQLLVSHGLSWARGIAKYSRRTVSGGPAITFFRGMVAQAAVDPELFIDRGSYILKLAPIRHIDFAPLRPGLLERLLDSEALGQLDSVGFADSGLDDAAVEAIAAAPRLAGCLHLDLRGNAIGLRGFEALASSPHLRQLLVVEAVRPSGLQAVASGARWLRPENRVSRYDARWYVDHGLRPVPDSAAVASAAHGGQNGQQR